MDLKELKTPTPHPLKAIFNRYNRGQISKKLGIKSTYLGNILNGHYQPGDKLEKNMQILSKKIIAAEKKSL